MTNGTIFFTMAKRMQEQKGEERIVAKSQSTAMKLSSHKSPGILIATGRHQNRMRRISKSDAASSSQVPLEDAHLGVLMDTATGKPVATKEESVDFSESETWRFQEEAVTVRLVAYKTVTEKPVASSKSDQLESAKAERNEWPHILHMSPATVRHMEAVFSIVRKISGREHSDPVDDLEVNMTIWAYFWIPLFEQQFILDKTLRRIYYT